MSRNSEECFELYEELYNKGINLIFVKEPHINTETYKSDLDSNIKITNTTSDYILEGINKYLLALAKEQIKLAFIQSEKDKDFQGTLKDIEVMRLIAISRNSYYKYKKELIEELG